MFRHRLRAPRGPSVRSCCGIGTTQGEMKMQALIRDTLVSGWEAHPPISRPDTQASRAEARPASASPMHRQPSRSRPAFLGDIHWIGKKRPAGVCAIYFIAESRLFHGQPAKSAPFRQTSVLPPPHIPGGRRWCVPCISVLMIHQPHPVGCAAHRAGARPPGTS